MGDGAWSAAQEFVRGKRRGWRWGRVSGLQEANHRGPKVGDIGSGFAGPLPVRQGDIEAVEVRGRASRCHPQAPPPTMEHPDYRDDHRRMVDIHPDHIEVLLHDQGTLTGFRPLQSAAARIMLASRRSDCNGGGAEGAK